MTVKELFNRQLTGEWTTSGKDVQWRFSVVDGINLLEFQCTSTADDWIENLKFWPKFTHDSMFIHAGFCEMWRSISADIASKTFDISKDAIFIITGYSQGSALATISGYCFKALGYNVKLITFGCPRIFWGYVPIKIRKLLFGTHYAVRGDIVTHLPPAILGYSRGGKCVRIGPKSMIKVEKHEPVNYQNYLPDAEV